MSDVTSFKVTGDWRHIVEDGIVDDDPLPDEVMPTGHVTFTPLSPRVAVAGVPATAYTLGADKALIAGGVLTDMQGRPGMSLAGKIGDTPVRWRAVIHLEYRGQKIDYPPVEFDLTEDVRLSGIIQQAGRLTPIVIDPRIEALAARLSDVDHVVADAEQIVADAGQSVVDAGLQADRARDEADRAIGLATAQDEAVAEHVVTDGRQTRTAVDERILAVGNATYDRIDVAPSGVLATDIANVIAAALAAKNAGRKSVRMSPGHYLLDGVTVADIHDRYLVGDSVTFSQDSWVYPFKSSDLAARSAGSASTGGRGRIAIEFDDGLLSHWRMVFPLTKELGITMGTAWHTSNGAKWIAEAHRHGWEVIAHLPENITATVYRDQGQLDAAAQSSLAQIKTQTGTDKGIGFVYPQHVRDLDTDRILSKYFTYGRGLSSQKIYPPDAGHEWLTSSTRLDNNMTLDGVNSLITGLLDKVAATNGGLVFYFHHDPTRHDVAEAGLRDLVAKCRARGIAIVNPSQIAATRRLPIDTYFDRGEMQFSQAMTASTERAYHGTTSAKLTTPEASPGTGRIAHPFHHIASRPGMFAVYRASVRRWHDTDITVTSNGQGLKFDVALWRRSLQSPDLAASPGYHSSRMLPLSGTTIPATSWGRHQELLYLPPDVEAVTPSVYGVNLAPGSTPMWLDEFRMQHLDYVAQVVYPATLMGTGNVFVWTNVIDLHNQVISIVPASTPAGKITATTAANSPRILIKSTDPTDTMAVKIVITPGGSSYTDASALSADGA